MKIKTHTKQCISLAISLGTIALCGSSASAATISATGWNGDYVFAVGETFGPTVRNGYTYFTEDHAFATVARPGVSTSGAYTLGGTDFQMASYTGNNGIGITGGTLTLDTAASFTDISLMGTDTGSIASNITLNFSDASTTVVATSYSGWVNPGLIEPGLTNNGTGIGGVNATRPDGFTGGIDVFTHILTLVDQAKTLESITFNTSTDAVFAISGTVIPVPEPSSTALLGLGGLALILRRRK